jgi:hypothetical protein
LFPYDLFYAISTKKYFTLRIATVDAVDCRTVAYFADGVLFVQLEPRRDFYILLKIVLLHQLCLGLGGRMVIVKVLVLFQGVKHLMLNILK